MTYLKSFRSAFKINEADTQFTQNNLGVLQVSKASQYADVPELPQQMEDFENTSGMVIDQNSTELDLMPILIRAQLKIHDIESSDPGGQYNTELINLVKGFQQKKNLPQTGKVDHSTYNVLFGGEPLVASRGENKDKDKHKTQILHQHDNVISKEKFDKITGKIIDKIEGGYYHPNMMKKNPKKFDPEVFGKSGETMFGLDRHAGHGLFYKTPRPEERKDVFKNLSYIESGAYEYVSQDAEDFWTAIDDAGAKNNWEHGDRGGPLEKELRLLAGRIMQPSFNKYFKDYIDPEVQSVVREDEHLLFHFIYSTWNGPKFFKRFAQDINRAYRNGKTTADTLYKVAIDTRLKDPATRKSGEIMIELFGKPR
jgi:hypothetical protein